MHLLQAQSVGAPNAHMEMAKLLWDTQNCHRAIAELQQALAILPKKVRPDFLMSTSIVDTVLLAYLLQFSFLSFLLSIMRFEDMKFWNDGTRLLVLSR